MTRLRDAWVGWMQGVAVDMIVSGLLLYLGLTLIGLDYALVFAVISSLLVLIPYYGAFIGGLPPVLFGLADSPTKGLLALAVYVAVQQVESNFTIPLVMARTVNLHPAVIAIGVLVVGRLFGFAGLFVAVPVLSFITITIVRERTRSSSCHRRWTTTTSPTRRRSSRSHSRK
jgi:predicted PurR-regulated permease PerM